MAKHTAKICRYNSGKQPIHDNIQFCTQLQTCISDPCEHAVLHRVKHVHTHALELLLT